MNIDPHNPIVQLCAQGMEAEGNDNAKAAELYTQAWELATNDTEKCIAAHYVARVQQTVTDKLHWDKTAFAHAQKVDTEDIKAMYPSLLLNMAKGYEDAGEDREAIRYYKLAESYILYLNNDGYGAMISRGIQNGLNRLAV